MAPCTATRPACTGTASSPGQLGALGGLLADAGVNVLVQYSDHTGNLVLLVDDKDVPACREVIARWEHP
ncbi:hypothetical protein [Actinoallomurus bryophytorum]|uniref:hypothetical protein n=1 Tax=Actinoallomurus bryophytorum TaxID=1490222 RepID=UPI001152C8F9|nr:hypothetical protein [Actinoallomurus bryophytorum]